MYVIERSMPRNSPRDLARCRRVINPIPTMSRTITEPAAIPPANHGQTTRNLARTTSVAADAAFAGFISSSPSNQKPAPASHSCSVSGPMK